MAEQHTKDLSKIRNIGVIAHISSGKTTTSERIMFYTGKTYKVGYTDQGTTILNWMDEEKKRGITIKSGATTTYWRGHRINLIDTPGHVDFTVEVERCLRVLDGGVTIIDGEEGVQSQSETVWRQADKYKVPRICFINKMDKLGADFLYAAKTIEDKLGANLVIMNLPIGIEASFIGVVDLLNMKAIRWHTDDLGENFDVTDDIPADMKAQVEEYHRKMVEKISEQDDVLLEKYLNGTEPTIDELKKALRKAVVGYKLVPVYAGSSLKHKGVQPLLDAIVDYLPSPADLKDVKGINPRTQAEETRKLIPEESLAGLAFKIQNDEHVGRLTYFRVYSGILKAGSYIYNSTKDKQERVGRILLIHADTREEIKEAHAGEIVALVGLKDTTTGDTLCDELKPIVLEKITFPEPVLSLAIEPKTKSDQEKLGYALKRLQEEDPTFQVKVNHETGQTIISGVGELQLEVKVNTMKSDFGVEANVGAPQVAYKETISRETTGEGKYIKQSGGKGQYGHCLLRVTPKPRGEGFEFINEIKGGAIPAVFISSIEKGVKETMENGILMGYPMVDMSVAVYDGSFHEVDSSDIAFKIAASQALQAATKKAGLVLLEPIMKVEVTTPGEFMGAVIGDLSSKRAQITGSEERNKATIITGTVPLSELPGYATLLRSMTQGRASYYMEPSHYEEVPMNIQQKMLEKSTFTGRISAQQ
jgi:elongation factor G